jgi:uncharacterized OB-fold protein
MTTVVPRWEELATGLFEWDGDLEPGSELFLVASWCSGCDRHEFPFREQCLACGGTTVKRRLAPSGTISQFTSVNHPPPGGLVEVPYAVAVVDFPQGISILGLISNVSNSDDLSVGDEVRVVAVDVDGKIGFAYRVLRPDT